MIYWDAFSPVSVLANKSLPGTVDVQCWLLTLQGRFDKVSHLWEVLSLFRSMFIVVFASKMNLGESMASAKLALLATTVRIDTVLSCLTITTMPISSTYKDNMINIALSGFFIRDYWNCQYHRILLNTF